MSTIRNFNRKLDPGAVQKARKTSPETRAMFDLKRKRRAERRWLSRLYAGLVVSNTPEDEIGYVRGKLAALSAA